MLDMLRKFFDFCSKTDRNKFYKSVVLGVFDAIFGAMKIPAAFFAITAVVNKEINSNTFIIVMGFMFVSTIGKMVVNRFSQMLQTEAGYNTCCSFRNRGFVEYGCKACTVSRSPHIRKNICQPAEEKNNAGISPDFIHDAASVAF